MWELIKPGGVFLIEDLHGQNPLLLDLLIFLTVRDELLAKDFLYAVVDSCICRHKGRVLARHQTGYSDTFLVSTTQIGLVSTTYGVSICITTVLYGCIASKAILLF